MNRMEMRATRRAAAAAEQGVACGLYWGRRLRRR